MNFVKLSHAKNREIRQMFSGKNVKSRAVQIWWHFKPYFFFFISGRIYSAYFFLHNRLTKLAIFYPILFAAIYYKIALFSRGNLLKFVIFSAIVYQNLRFFRLSFAEISDSFKDHLPKFAIFSYIVNRNLPYFSRDHLSKFTISPAIVCWNSQFFQWSFAENRDFSRDCLPKFALFSEIFCHNYCFSAIFCWNSWFFS